MGNPIAHSKSPEIHGMFAEQTGQAIDYEAILVDTDKFAEALQTFSQANGKGFNITVPFKQQAWEHSNKRSQRAELAGAVNTITLTGNQIAGDNTDGIGLVRDLTQNQHFNFTNSHILIAGAGGAVRGVLLPILEQQPADVIIANRTQSKAQKLANIFADYGPVSALGFDQLAGKSFDLIINGTAASLHGDRPPIPDNCVRETTALYDMMYASEPTRFMQWGAELGAERCIDGLGMLVEQAAESFYIWRGVKPETQPVIAALRAQMTA